MWGGNGKGVQLWTSEHETFSVTSPEGPLRLRKCAAGSQDSLRLPPHSDARTGVRRRLHTGEDDFPPWRLDTVRSDVCQEKTFVFVSIS